MTDYKISLISGPGQHANFIKYALHEKGLLQFVSTYPKISIYNYINRKKTSSIAIKIFNILEIPFWKFWAKVPNFTIKPSAQEFLYPVKDFLISRKLLKCDLLIGFDFISLYSLRRAKKLGAIVVLEYAMAYIDIWMDTLEEEKQIWGKSKDSCQSSFHQNTVARLKLECEASDFITVLSSFAKKTFLQAGFDENKLIVTPLGIDTEKFHLNKIKNSRTGNFRFLYVGRIELLKGVQYLLQAFSELNLKGAELLLVGQVFPEIVPIIKKFANDNVKFTGAVDQDELIKLYHSSNALVFPSINDSFGLVILEAMACGLPVITTNHTCGTDVIDHGTEGFVLPIRDVELMKEKMIYLYENNEACEKMGISARKKVEENFTLEHYSNRILTEYTRLLKSNRK